MIDCLGDSSHVDYACGGGCGDMICIGINDNEW